MIECVCGVYAWLLLFPTAIRRGEWIVSVFRLAFPDPLPERRAWGELMPSRQRHLPIPLKHWPTQGNGNAEGLPLKMSLIRSLTEEMSGLNL